MKKSFAIIGLGRFGLSVAKTLASLKCDVIALDSSSERVNIAAEYITNCVICDATKRENLEELGIGNVDEAVIAIGGNLEATILTTINLKDIGVKRISVRLDDSTYKNVLERLGATEVFTPEDSFGVEFAKQIAKSDNLNDYFEIDKQYGVVEFKVKEDFEAKSIIELDIRKKFDVLVVAIQKGDKISLPFKDDLIEPNTTLFVAGKYEKTLKFESFING